MLFFLKVTRVSHQTTAGRQRSIRALVVVGNKDGVAGMTPLHNYFMLWCALNRVCYW